MSEQRKRENVACVVLDASIRRIRLSNELEKDDRYIGPVQYFEYRQSVDAVTKFLCAIVVRAKRRI